VGYLTKNQGQFPVSGAILYIKAQVKLHGTGPIIVLPRNCCYNQALPSARPQPDTMTKHLLRLLLLGLPILSACSSLPPEPETATLAGAALSEDHELIIEPSAAPEPIEYGNFSRDQLELALLSELGGMRGHLPQAAEGYYRLALETQDAGILRRAIEYVSATANAQALAELADQWLKIAPDEIEPHLILGYQFMEQGLFVRALPHLEKVLALGGMVDFTAMSARTYALENRQRDIIITRLTDIMTRHPAEESLYQALAQIYDQNGDDANARRMLEQARLNFGDSPRTVLIEAQLLQNTGATDAAEASLALGVERYPMHRLLRYSYAQILVQQNKLGEAAVQFTELLRQEPQDMETLYSLVLINLELDQLSLAEAQLRDLLRSGHRLSETHYYLAYVLERREQPEEALFHYQQIPRQANAFLNAQRQIMRLLVALRRFEDARTWSAQMSAADSRLAPLYPGLLAEALIGAGEEEFAADALNNALERFPDSTDLLFARTLLSERQHRLGDAERDLRRIISINPDDARALNHLGYSLLIHSDRYSEALDLIERAVAIAPDDPAIIDSLGWAQYKLGYLDDALYNLQIAYAAFPDPEVAAHLGEVLWVMGREAEALLIWDEGLSADPDSEHVIEAKTRLTGFTD
jgi:tetratricopeptide (TPR) repeat protein